MSTESLPTLDPAGFHTTRWTRVCLAKADSDDGRAALADLCAAYYEPVVAFLRCELRDADGARELSHAFFAEVLAGGAIQTADRERGRFRCYLLGAVKHFLSRQRAAARRMKRGGGGEAVSMDDETVSAVPDERQVSPDAAFDRQWALTVLTRALAALRIECASERREAFFDQVKPWLMGEAGHGDQAALAAACGLSPAALKMAVHRLKRRFRQWVKAEVAGTLDDPALVDAEFVRRPGRLINPCYLSPPASQIPSMSDSSSSPNQCVRCGAVLPDAPEGLCPRCLMEEAMQPTEAGDQAARMQTLTPEDVAPRFPHLDIIECLGRGGMGVVYKARQKSLNRLVALKLLAPEREKDPQFAQRFAHEAQALAALSHPNIVTVYEFGQTEGLYFLLMEFVDGVNLRQLLQAKRLTPKEALSIVPPVCEALQCAHDHGVVHRDIKPENLLIDKAGVVKIADFGIAKILSGSADVPIRDESQPAGAPASFLFGTPDYAAPEQLDNTTAADHRADIYSLGVVLYEMLTGERPKDDIVPPSKRVQVDVRIDEIVLRALEKTPALRFQTAGEFRTQVETLILPASSKQDARPEISRWMRLAPVWMSSFLTRLAETGNPKDTKRFGKNAIVAGFILAAVLVIIAVFGPRIARFSFSPPSSEFDPATGNGKQSAQIKEAKTDAAVTRQLPAIELEIEKRQLEKTLNELQETQTALAAERMVKKEDHVDVMKLVSKLNGLEGQAARLRVLIEQSAPAPRD